jgi:predicted O-methyltransferase YrrM
MSTALEFYKHLTELVDPNDPVVIEEIKTGLREPSGVTDVHDHLPLLREAAHGNILEIGVRFGVSTAALLLGVELRGGHVYSVDTEDCSSSFSELQWTFIQANSVTDVEKIKSLIPAELDLLFIDGDHSYEGVLSDLTNFGPCAKIVILHDAAEHGHPSVSKAIDHYFTLPDCRQIQRAFFPASHGLAVLS